MDFTQLPSIADQLTDDQKTALAESAGYIGTVTSEVASMLLSGYVVSASRWIQVNADLISAQVAECESRLKALSVAEHELARLSKHMKLATRSGAARKVSTGPVTVEVAEDHVRAENEAEEDRPEPSESAQKIEDELKARGWAWPGQKPPENEAEEEVDWADHPDR